MDAEIVKALADLPIVGILIYLLIRAQGQNDKLLIGLIESERQHARNLVEIVCSGKLKIDLDDVSKVAKLNSTVV